MTAVPTRLRVAADLVDRGPGVRVLDVGCGPGVLVGMLCERLPEGHVTGLDRSATAIERAERRLARWLAAGAADLQHRELADFHGHGGAYDVALAVNVNVFWTGPAEVEAARVRDLVADDGVVHLVFELPPGADADRVRDGALASLSGAGLACTTAVVDGVLCVTGRP